MEINEEIEIQDLKYEIRDFRRKNKELKNTINTLFSKEDVVAFGNFIIDNYHGVGAPNMISYDHTK
ncbi:MAG: hypothetical protein WD512_19025 [Candidatus Paceibacterota bacterium]